MGEPSSASSCHLKTAPERFSALRAEESFLRRKMANPILTVHHQEQQGSRVLLKAFFSGARPRHLSLMPYFSGLHTPRDLHLHFACLRIKKEHWYVLQQLQNHSHSRGCAREPASFIRGANLAIVLSGFALFRYTRPSSGPNQKPTSGLGWLLWA